MVLKERSKNNYLLQTHFSLAVTEVGFGWGSPGGGRKRGE